MQFINKEYLFCPKSYKIYLSEQGMLIVYKTVQRCICLDDCHTHAAIPAVRLSFHRGPNTVKPTDRSTRKRYDRHQAGDTGMPGSGRASGFCGLIPSAPSALRKDDTSRQRSSATSFCTAEMRSCSGIRTTCSLSAKAAMTRRPGRRIATRSITTDVLSRIARQRPPRGGVKSLCSSEGRPVHPLA